MCKLQIDGENNSVGGNCRHYKTNKSSLSLMCLEVSDRLFKG